MKHHADSQRSDRLAVMQPVRPPARRLTFRTKKQLTAPADRRLRAAAGAFVVSTGVAAGYVRRRLSPRSFTDHRNRPGSSRATDCRQNPPPALPAIRTRCLADHRPVWRCAAGADVHRADGACTMGRARAERSAPHNAASTRTKPLLCVNCRNLPKMGGAK